MQNTKEMINNRSYRLMDESEMIERILVLAEQVRDASHMGVTCPRETSELVSLAMKLALMRRRKVT
jgi:hypothetical protein